MTHSPDHDDDLPGHLHVVHDADNPPSENAAAPEADMPDEVGGMVEALPDGGRDPLRMIEALLYASATPLSATQLADRLPAGLDIAALIEALQARYEGRGVELVEVAGRFQFRTAPDLAFLLEREAVEERRLSRAALETLAIVAYHQPVSRAEIEEIRGVTVSKGTLDVLMELGWVKVRGRRQVPGRPVVYGTAPAFLEHFGLSDLKDLPGLEELKGAGLLDQLPPEPLGPTTGDEEALEPANDDDAAEDLAELDDLEDPDALEGRGA